MLLLLFLGVTIVGNLSSYPQVVPKKNLNNAYITVKERYRGLDIGMAD